MTYTSTYTHLDGLLVGCEVVEGDVDALSRPQRDQPRRVACATAGYDFLLVFCSDEPRRVARATAGVG